MSYSNKIYFNDLEWKDHWGLAEVIVEDMVDSSGEWLATLSYRKKGTTFHITFKPDQGAWALLTKEMRILKSAVHFANYIRSTL